MSEPVLSLRGITKRFGGLTAVRDVSLEIFPGEVVALLGDNGAGKSTLIKCISGVHTPDEGEIFLNGRRHIFRGRSTRGGRGSRRSTRTWRWPTTSTSAPTSSSAVS